MFALTLKIFLRSPIAATGIGFILLAGVSSVHIGKQFLKQQEQSIRQTITFQQDHIHRNVQYHPDEMGLLLYYLRFAYVNTPDRLAGLAIGQRDVNASIQSLTIRALEGQRYDTDFYNPANLLSGNLDFSFVLIYLFPLLIIAYSYNLLSEEEEGGTWRLVCVQARFPLQVLLQKMLIRSVAVYGALGILLGYAVVLLSLAFNPALLGLVAVAVMYLAFWFVLSFWVISWYKSSSINAVSLLTFWVLLTIIFPALGNNYLVNKYPVPEAFHTVVAQREGYHEKWDMDKKITMDKFYQVYPQYRHYPLSDKEFSWLWYYAMQQTGDWEAQPHAREMAQKLWSREHTSHVLSMFVPSMHTQLQLTNLAHSGLKNQLHFLESTAQFHEKRKAYFIPKIVEEVPVHKENWSQWKVEYFTEAGEVNWLFLLLPMPVWMIGLLAGTWLNLRKDTIW